MITSITFTPTLKLPILEVKRSLYFQNEPLRKNIKPIPIIRRNILNSQKKLEKFRIEGNKYFSKLSASGEKTHATLKDIRKSRKIKVIKKFEFDPYLCDQSNLKPLSYILNKLRDTIAATFVFRRVNYRNETDILIPFIPRMRRIIKQGIEFPKTSDIDDKGFIRVQKAFAKICTITRVRASYIEVQDVAESTYLMIPKLNRKRRRLEDLSVTIIRKGDISATQDEFFPDGRSCSQSRLKRMTFHCGIKSGWFSMSPETGASCISFLRAMKAAPLLSSLNLKFNSIPIMDEALSNIASMLPSIPLLKNFSIEMSNCKVSDTEICSFAQELRNFSQVEQFTLKVIQYPNLFENCVLYFATMISRVKNFKKFDLYFRRMSTEEEGMAVLVDKINLLENTKCTHFRQSLHIYRD